MKPGDAVRFMSNLGIIVKQSGFSPYYGEIWEVYLPSRGETYSLGEYRLEKINEKNT